MPIDRIVPLAPPSVPAVQTSVSLRPPSPPDLDRTTFATGNPFLAVRSGFSPPPAIDDVRRDLDAALRGDPRRAETRAAILAALVDLQNASLAALSPDDVDALFRQLAAALETWPDTTWARDLVAVAVATLGVHLSWKNDGARTLAALAPTTVEAFRALARYVDGHAASYGEVRRSASTAAAGAMPVLTDREAERSDVGLEATLDALIGQTHRYGGLGEPAPAPEATGLRALGHAIVRYAEARKSAALQQLERADDLSQAAIMRLQEELQAANQLIMAMSQILRKEGELSEQLARNVA